MFDIYQFNVVEIGTVKEAVLLILTFSLLIMFFIGLIMFYGNTTKTKSKMIYFLVLFVFIIVFFFFLKSSVLLKENYTFKVDTYGKELTILNNKSEESEIVTISDYRLTKYNGGVNFIHKTNEDNNRLFSTKDYEEVYARLDQFFN